MRRTLLTTVAAGAALSLALAAPALAGKDDHKNNKRFAGEDVAIADCNDSGGEKVGEIITDGDATLWPPNHKYAPYDITAQDTEGTDATHVWSTLTHDEYVTSTLPDQDEAPEGSDQGDNQDEMNGSGNTLEDGRPFYDDDDNADGTAETHHEIRAERSGRGDGRTYTFRVWADFDDDDQADCRGDFTVEVPHDLGQGAEHKNVTEPGDA